MGLLRSPHPVVHARLGCLLRPRVPFDQARQLALTVGGFNLSDLAKTFQLLDSASGACKLLTPQQRLRKRAFSMRQVAAGANSETEFSARHLVDGLHTIITLYLEEESMDEIQARVTYEQQKLDLDRDQQALDLDSTLDEDE